MKRAISLFVALALILSLSLTVFAAPDTGSITVTNATIGKTYNIYKIFDATIKQDALGNTEAVSYSIQPDNQFFATLFGDNGQKANPYFVYDIATGIVTKRDTAVDSELIAYLTNLVQNGSFESAAATQTATTEEVKFDNLSYGYYMIVSSLGAAVTINSNTPDVEVIDKNQKPGTDFEKQIKIGVDANGDPIYADSGSFGIGDVFDYKISFTATNYDGADKIKYYQVHDKKGSALWVEFDDINVYVNGEELQRGYYLFEGNGITNTHEWEYLGDWSGFEQNCNNAQWYLVHIGYDEFKIVIPWLENHTVTDVKDPETDVVVSHNLEFPADAQSKFDSPVDVEVTYSATIEADAFIGNSGVDTNLFNSATGSWSGEGFTGTTPGESPKVEVHGIGLVKIDATTRANLAGAEFRLYEDEACLKPVYVIPTNVKGVYILDSLYTDGGNVSGTNMETTREKYAAYLEEYLGSDYETKQDNLVVSQVNGKLAVLGLAEGTYYLKEVKAPDGYNALNAPIKIEAGNGAADFSIFADTDGNVADIQSTDGVHKENIYQVTSTTVENSKGVELPSTGGEGTFWLITVGTILAFGFAVLLITHKKMSVYTD